MEGDPGEQTCMENLEDKPNGWSWRVILAKNKLETILENESGGCVILESNLGG